MAEHHVMLAHSVQPEDLDKLKYPLLVSPKYDGVRAFTDYMGDLRSRADRRFNNSSLYALFGKLPKGLDGELIVGKSPGDTTSFVNSLSDNAFDVKYYVFDYCLRSYSNKEFTARRRFLEVVLSQLFSERPFLKDIIRLVSHVYVNNADEALDFYNDSVKAPYPENEGICLRDPDGIYKFGRSTLRQQYLIKVKETETAEAAVVRLEPLTQNGRVHNSLGAIVCKCRNFTDEFNIGTGFTEEERYKLWRSLKQGDIIRFKYKIQGGVTRPVQPVYLGVSQNVSDL